MGLTTREEKEALVALESLLQEQVPTAPHTFSTFFGTAFQQVSTLIYVFKH